MIKTLAAAIVLCSIGVGANAQTQWNSYNAPGSPWTNSYGSDGSTGTSYHPPGSPWTNTTINGADGQQQHCATYQAPGSPYASTTCN